MPQGLCSGCPALQPVPLEKGCSTARGLPWLCWFPAHLQDSRSIIYFLLLLLFCHVSLSHHLLVFLPPLSPDLENPCCGLWAKDELGLLFVHGSLLASAWGGCVLHVCDTDTLWFMEMIEELSCALL